MRQILLDTNSLNGVFKKTDKTILQSIDQADKVFLSVIVLGELLSGFKGGRYEKKNRQILENLLSETSVEIALLTEETAEIYSDILVKLRKQGTPIPTNDIWIAAQTIETGAKLITFDQHFLHISGLRVWDKLK